jgi:hypothetical protein
MRVTVCDYCQKKIEGIWSLEIKIQDRSPSKEITDIGALMEFCEPCASRLEGEDLRLVFLKGMSECAEKDVAVL